MSYAIDLFVPVVTKTLQESYEHVCCSDLKSFEESDELARTRLLAGKIMKDFHLEYSESETSVELTSHSSEVQLMFYAGGAASIQFPYGRTDAASRENAKTYLALLRRLISEGYIGFDPQLEMMVSKVDANYEQQITGSVDSTNESLSKLFDNGSKHSNPTEKPWWQFW